MPKQLKQGHRPKDLNQLVHDLVDLSTEGLDQPDQYPNARSIAVSQYMAEIGRKGGQIGGKRRLKTMTAEERRKIAKRAARARWGKARKTSGKS